MEFAEHYPRRCDPARRELFAKLFKRVRHEVESFALHLCRNMEYPSIAAQELLQETCVVAWLRFHRLTHKSHFKYWTFAIMKQTYFNQVRLERRREKYVIVVSLTDLTEIQDQPHSFVEQHPRVMMMCHALKRLQPHEREALLLYSLGGYSIRELCSLQQCSNESMRARLSRARKKMRRFIRQDEEREPSEGIFPEDLIEETIRIIEEIVDADGI